MKLCTLIPAVVVFFATSAQAQTLVAEGLQFPQKLTVTPAGSVLVSEGGTATPNTGRVSIVPKTGSPRTILEGLPAGPGHGIPAFGPTGIVLDGKTLYLVIGEGDINVGPPPVLNPAGPSSPIFATVLRFQFSTDVDLIQSPFDFETAHTVLADGRQLELYNPSGDKVTAKVLSSFRPYGKNTLGGTSPLRVSDPYGAALDATGKSLYVVDSSSETIVKIDTATGESVVLIRFQPDVRAEPRDVPRPDHFDTVPTAVCPRDDSMLISFLSGAPFPPGAASVRRWTPADTGWAKLTPLIGGLTAVTDMICLDGPSISAPRFVTVEFSQDFSSPTVASGKVQLFEGTSSKVLADKLNSPTGVAVDPTSGDLLVVTLSGQILRIAKP